MKSNNTLILNKMNPFEEFNDWIDNLAVPVVLTDELKETIKEQAKALINW